MSEKMLTTNVDLMMLQGLLAMPYWRDDDSKHLRPIIERLLADRAAQAALIEKKDRELEEALRVAQVRLRHQEAACERHSHTQAELDDALAQAKAMREALVLADQIIRAQLPDLPEYRNKIGSALTQSPSLTDKV